MYSASRKAKKLQLEKEYPSVNSPTSVERMLGIMKKNDDVRISECKFDDILARIVSSVAGAVERGDARRENATLMDKFREHPGLTTLSPYGISSRTGYCVETVNKTMQSEEFKKWINANLTNLRD